MGLMLLFSRLTETEIPIENLLKNLPGLQPDILIAELHTYLTKVPSIHSIKTSATCVREMGKKLRFTEIIPFPHKNREKRYTF